MKKSSIIRSIVKFLGTKIVKVRAPIIESIVYSKVEDVILYITTGENPNFICYNGGAYCYPLMMAVYAQKHQICDIMIRHGKNVNVNFRMDVHPMFLFDDPSHLITNLSSRCLMFDSKHWICLTPTVLSLLKGDSILLSLCFEFGGSLKPFFKNDKSFLRFFLRTPKICTLELADVLISHNCFELTKSEMSIFREEYERYYSGDVSPNYKKRLILDKLFEFGFSIHSTEEEDDEEQTFESGFSLSDLDSLSLSEGSDDIQSMDESPETIPTNQGFQPTGQKEKIGRKRSFSHRLAAPRIHFSLSLHTNQQRKRRNSTPISNSSSPCEEEEEEEEENDERKKNKNKKKKKKTSCTKFLERTAARRRSEGSLTPCRMDFPSFSVTGRKKKDLRHVSRSIVNKSIKRRRKAKGKLRQKEGDEVIIEKEGKFSPRKIHGVLFTWTTGEETL